MSNKTKSAGIAAVVFVFFYCVYMLFFFSFTHKYINYLGYGADEIMELEKFIALLSLIAMSAVIFSTENLIKHRGKIFLPYIILFFFILSGLFFTTNTVPNSYRNFGLSLFHAPLVVGVITGILLQIYAKKQTQT